MPQPPDHDDVDKDEPGHDRDAPPDAPAAADVEDDEATADTHLARTYHRSVMAGEERLHRTIPNLVATGFVGGMDVGVGVIALAMVLTSTGNEMAAALAFSAGFVTLVLAHSELFTENFLVPVTVVVTERRGTRDLGRLWFGTLVTNWAGGALLMALFVSAVPRVHPTVRELGAFYPDMGICWRSFTSAVLGGVIITLMTWIERAAESVSTSIVTAVITGFLLAAPPLNHSVVGALEMMAGLFVGETPYGWLSATTTALWAALGNVVGGVFLVTVLRLVQVGSEAIEAERHTHGTTA